MAIELALKSSDLRAFNSDDSRALESDDLRAFLYDGMMFEMKKVKDVK